MSDSDISNDANRMSLPDPYSARSGLSGRQAAVGAALCGVVVIGLVVDWSATLSIVVTAASVCFLLLTLDRGYLLLKGMHNGQRVTVPDDAARGLRDDELPVYTVLLPVYDEPYVVGHMLEVMRRIDYPADKLDILLLLEADDSATISAFEASKVPGIKPVLVPPSEPRTKPKACDVAMQMDFERSECVTIFDVEDIPDPLQLRRAAWVFRNSGPEVAALQARLGYYNERQNLLTKWFAIEYDQWFRFVLPALSSAGCVIPLGGTSNHLRTEVLRQVGGWDPYNVTEDADLGVRLARGGYRTLILDSGTAEEANPDAVNWLRQRSRWYKGYLQTFLVHTRHPIELSRQLGLVPALRFAALTAGMPIVNILNIVFWTALVLWYAGRPEAMFEVFPAFTYFLCLALFTVGNAFSAMLGIVSTRATEKPYLLSAALLVPGYWLLQAVAASKAVAQMVYKPSYWEKTVHGLAVRTDRKDKE